MICQFDSSLFYHTASIFSTEIELEPVAIEKTDAGLMPEETEYDYLALGYCSLAAVSPLCEHLRSNRFQSPACNSDKSPRQACLDCRHALALGYGGSVGALKSMGALDMGLSEEELQPLVNSWRASNPMITAFWRDVDRAVKTAITQRIPTEVRSIHFFYKIGMLFIQLPSGRRPSYVKPRIGTNQFGGESVTYEGVGTTKKWERSESYGPKFVENIVQAISRDILCNAMKTLRHCFIVGHVHDELIIECSPGVDLKAVCEQMADPRNGCRISCCGRMGMKHNGTARTKSRLKSNFKIRI